MLQRGHDDDVDDHECEERPKDADETGDEDGGEPAEAEAEEALRHGEVDPRDDEGDDSDELGDVLVHKQGVKDNNGA